MQSMIKLDGGASIPDLPMLQFEIEGEDESNMTLVSDPATYQAKLKQYECQLVAEQTSKMQIIKRLQWWVEKYSNLNVLSEVS